MTIKTKVSNDGKKVTMSMTTEGVQALLGKLKPGKERDQLTASFELAKKRSAHVVREERLAQPIAAEMLTQLGWQLTGNYSPMAFGAIRAGDFRFDQRDGGYSGWVYGPPGAFDREPDGTIIRRNAVQAGVMSEIHAVYRLLEPTTNKNEAIKQAEGMEKDWLAQLPAKRRRPAGATPHTPAKYWSHNMSASDFEFLPEGATVSRGPNSVESLQARSTDSDDQYNGMISIYECDAVLGPVTRLPFVSGHALRTTEGLDWMEGNRLYDPSYDGRSDIRRILSGPYDCVLGRVWAAVCIQRTASQDNNFFWLGQQSRSMDMRANQVFPLPTREAADAAAKYLAVKYGVLENHENESTTPPSPLPIPDFEVANDLLAA